VTALTYMVEYSRSSFVVLNLIFL